MAAAALMPIPGQVHDLLQHRLERALRERVRYRYVKPTVLLEGDSYRVQSPCCSRRVDPAGGLIDIALLVPHEGNSWCLCSRDHSNQSWVARFQNESLATVLDLLCVDSEHQFWL
jgi:hypothetical protein